MSTRYLFTSGSLSKSIRISFPFAGPLLFRIFLINVKLMETKVSINLVVYNGEKYIRHCLNVILAQTYPHELTEINFLDNNSADKTKEIIGSWSRENEKLFNKCNLVELTENIGVWPGQEKLLKYSDGKYVLGLCVDVILDKNFIKNAVESIERDP